LRSAICGTVSAARQLSQIKEKDQDALDSRDLWSYERLF
jgi:hypothetical protein